ncbi:MAG: hypothetical protein ABII88_11100 [Candidatus Omnitrophota bacterium]
MVKGFAIFTVIFTVLVVCSGLCFAIEGGTRPISMGGAFVAIADDAHAVSWNPAGMAWQEDFELTYSAILNNRDKYICGDFMSDDYLSLCAPIKAGYKSDFNSFGAVGLFVNNTGYKQGGANTEIFQPGISYGKQIFSDNFAVGVSLSSYALDVSVPNISDNDTVYSINLGVLWYINEHVTFGCLWENVNEPTYSLFNITNRLVRNLRPGIAYYFSENTVITMDIYDLTGNTEDRASDYSQDIRIGFEHYLNDDISLRVGAHHPNSDVDSSKYYSCGFGWQRSDFMGVYPVSYYLDYGFVYWPEAPTGTDTYTHQLGATLKF